MKNVIRIMRCKPMERALLVMAMLMMPVLAHAQTGCTDSPENPTVVLAIVGSAGALFSSVRSRLKTRRGSNGNQ